MTKPSLFSRNRSLTGLFLAGCLCLLSNFLTAQTPVEDLQKGVEIYNAMREYIDGLSPKALTTDQIGDVKNRLDKGVALLEKVVREGNAEEIRAARYFKNNFFYEYGFVLGMKGENAKAFDLYHAIEKEFTGLSASDFPIRYVFFGKNFIVQWDNFAPTQAEFLTGMAEICYNLGKYEDAIRFNRQAIVHPNTSPWLKYISTNKMLDLSEKSPGLLNDSEYYDFAVQAIQRYEALDSDSRITVKENNYPSFRRGVNIIYDNAVKNNVVAQQKCPQAAALAASEDYYEKTLQLFDLSYRNKSAVDASFHNTAETYARKAFPSNPSKAGAVGISATDALALLRPATDCSGLDGIIEKYNFWKQSAKAAMYVKKKEECLANEAKMRKKEARRLRRSNRSFNFYTGMYVFPLLKSNAHRDYGGVVNFAGKKFAMEFSYLNIKLNKDNVFDLRANDVNADQEDIPRWNGFYAHIHPKFITNKNLYVGPLLGYAEKRFEATSINITRDADGVVSTGEFRPKATQYIAMVNMGALGLGRGVGIDMYWGIGAAYSRWELGGDIDPEQYTLSNLALEKRKSGYFGPIMRIGLSVGLNFGRGNMR